MQLHKKIFIVALVLSICISLYFLINPSNIFTFPIRVHSFDDTFKYYMFVKIGIVLLFIKFLLDICLEYIKNWFKKFWYIFTQKSLRKRFSQTLFWAVALFYRSHCLREISPLLIQRSLPSVSWTSSCPLSEISLARPW